MEKAKRLRCFTELQYEATKTKLKNFWKSRDIKWLQDKFDVFMRYKKSYKADLKPREDTLYFIYEEY